MWDWKTPTPHGNYYLISSVLWLGILAYPAIAYLLEDSSCDELVFYPVESL